MSLFVLDTDILTLCYRSASAWPGIHSLARRAGKTPPPRAMQARSSREGGVRFTVEWSYIELLHIRGEA